jgi:hypothetical protein
MKLIIALVATLGVSAQNPLQKVTQLLGELQQKVLKEGEVEQKNYEKFAEWCKDEAVAKQYEIQDGKTKVESCPRPSRRRDRSSSRWRRRSRTWRRRSRRTTLT